MGRTRFSGPVYGAKALLWSAHIKDAAVSTTTTTMGSINVPTGQDWLITDIHAWRGSTVSTGFRLTVTDDSTTVGTVSITSSLASQTGQSAVTPAAGEDEGYIAAAGSSLTMTFDQTGSSVAASTAVTGWVYGFIRFVSSSRAE